MVKKCIICNENIKEDYGKLNGTLIKATNEKNKNQFIYVCSECQKQKDWLNTAKIKGV